MTNFGKGLLALVVLSLAIALIVLLRDVLFEVGIGLLAVGGIIALAGVVAVLLRIGAWAWGPIEHLRLKRAERRLMEARADAEAERVPLIPEGYIGTRLAHPAERANLVIWGGRGWSTEAPTLVAEEAEKEEEAAPPDAAACGGALQRHCASDWSRADPHGHSSHRWLAATGHLGGI